MPSAARPASHSAQDEQLAALRSLLVGPLSRELENLRQRVAELEDPEQLTTKLAEHLPQALDLRPTTGKQMAEALSPLLKAALWELRQRGETGGTLRDTLKLGLRQVHSGVSHMAGALLGCFSRSAQIVRLRLIHRTRHTQIEEYIGTFQEPEARATGSMLELLQEKLRDPDLLAGYHVVESIRVQNITYGIHVGPLAILLSAIRGRRPANALARCKASLETIHQTHAVALGMFDPAEKWTPILSGETSIIKQTSDC
jgi:hypothetical protein